MAIRAPKPCKSHGCGVLSRDGSSYCSNHKAQSSGWNAPGRGTAASRGYGHSWTLLRKRVMQRDKCLCQPCVEQGRLSRANAVDHIIPRSQGGGNDPMNLQAICSPCHKDKTNTEARAAQG